jgi:CRISPR-associated protein Cmr4
MKDFRTGYLYSLAPVHCGGEGDLGNILEIAREVHTNFPYIPASSLRGSLRDEVESIDLKTSNILFGEELTKDNQMGVHQVWFGDARLLWIPMRTMSKNNRDVFTWVSCHSLIRDHNLRTGLPGVNFPDQPVGDQTGNYSVTDAQLNVTALNEAQKKAIDLVGDWHPSLTSNVQSIWDKNRIVLSDADFQVLMEHSLWTQVRNKIQDESDGKNPEGTAEVFWTDICIPRDTIFYYSWGYSLLKNPDKQVKSAHHETLLNSIQGLFQVGGQANIGRGWVQSWVADAKAPAINS